MISLCFIFPVYPRRIAIEASGQKVGGVVPGQQLPAAAL